MIKNTLIKHHSLDFLVICSFLIQRLAYFSAIFKQASLSLKSKVFKVHFSLTTNKTKKKDDLISLC